MLRLQLTPILIPVLALIGRISFVPDPAMAAFILDEGQDLVYEFTELDLVGDSLSNNVGVGLDLVSDLFDTSDIIELNLYEDSIQDEPFESVTITGDGHCCTTRIAIGVLWLTIPPSVPWQDLQGVVRYRMLNGSIGIDSLDFSHALAGQGLYSKSFDSSTIPEPSTALLLGFGLMALAAGRRRR